LASLAVATLPSIFARSLYYLCLYVKDTSRISSSSYSSFLYCRLANYHHPSYGGSSSSVTVTASSSSSIFLSPSLPGGGSAELRGVGLVVSQREGLLILHERKCVSLLHHQRCLLNTETMGWWALPSAREASGLLATDHVEVLWVFRSWCVPRERRRMALCSAVEEAESSAMRMWHRGGRQRGYTRQRNTRRQPQKSSTHKF
jgi:hypothetical protein